MAKKGKQCLATLKNGKPCRYKGKLEYKGYCGLHRSSLTTDSRLEAMQRDERLAQLLGAGAALIEITTKAIEHLPSLIEVILKVSHVAFVKEHQFNSEGITRPPEMLPSPPNEEQNVVFKYAPKTLPSEIAFQLENADWRSLANLLSYDFDVKLDSGNVPDALRVEIDNKKRELQKMLAAFGYEPGIHTAQRPVFLRALE